MVRCPARRCGAGYAPQRLTLASRLWESVLAVAVIAASATLAVNATERGSAIAGPVAVAEAQRVNGVRGLLRDKFSGKGEDHRDGAQQCNAGLDEDGEHLLGLPGHDGHRTSDSTRPLIE